MILWRRPPNTTRPINMSPCRITSAPVSLLQMSIDFPNGMLLTPLFLTFPPLMMVSLDMGCAIVTALWWIGFQIVVWIPYVF